MSNEKCDHCGARWGIGDNQWISVKDRLPEKNRRVFVFLKNEYVNAVVEAYFNQEWLDYREHFELEEITHWMPLPNPPNQLKVKND